MTRKGDAMPLDLTTLWLHKGAHPNNVEGCLLEWTSRAAGEAWSDHPQSVCPILAAYGRTLNDRLDDTNRQRLIPLIPKLLHTRSTLEVERARRWLLVDGAVRIFAPLALEAAKRPDLAARLRALAPVTPETAETARHECRAAADAAADAAYAAADAAADAAYAAAAAYVAAAAAYVAAAAADARFTVATEAIALFERAIAVTA